MPGMPSFQLWRLVVGGDPHFPVQSHGELPSPTRLRKGGMNGIIAVKEHSWLENQPFSIGNSSSNKNGQFLLAVLDYRKDPLLF